MKAIAIGTRRFEPKLWPSIAAAAFVMLTLSLGEWQTQRAREKLELQARMDALAAGPVAILPPRTIEAKEFVHKPVEVRGEFLADKTIFVDNRVYRGRPGYHVITPMKISGENINLVVNRGWVPANPRRDILPRVSTPTGEQFVRGTAIIPLEHVYELAPDSSEGPIRQSLSLARLGAQWGIPLQPIVLLQTGGSNDDLIRDWPRQDAGVDTHLAYALQWRVMAAVGALLWISLNLRRIDDAV